VCGIAQLTARLGAAFTLDPAGVTSDTLPGGDSAPRASVWGLMRPMLSPLGVDDRVGVPGLVAAGVADGLLAFVVGPAGAVGDQLPVVADEQPADDVPDGAKLGVAGLDQACPDVVRDAEVASDGLGVANSRLGAALLVLGGGVAELLIAAEVRLLPRGGAFVVLEVPVDEVDHEGGIDHPDAGGEVRAAVVREGVASVAGAVAGLAGDPDLQGPGLSAGG
jgi:hypothetical protein